MNTLKFSIFILSTLASPFAFSASQEGSIIYISRKLKMSSTEAASAKDFYVDLGERQGLKLGDILEVFRVKPVLNGVTGDASNFVKIHLGDIKIILLGEFSSIGRVQSVVDPKDLPVLDHAGFMLGDAVEPKSSLPFDGRTP